MRSAPPRTGRGGRTSHGRREKTTSRGPPPRPRARRVRRRPWRTGRSRLRGWQRSARASGPRRRAGRPTDPAPQGPAPRACGMPIPPPPRPLAHPQLDQTARAGRDFRRSQSGSDTQDSFPIGSAAPAGRPRRSGLPDGGANLADVGDLRREQPDERLSASTGQGNRMMRVLRCCGHSRPPREAWRSTTGTTRPR